jgi:hypothetical protein
MRKTETETLAQSAQSRNCGQGRGNLVFSKEVQYRAVS